MVFITVVGGGNSTAIFGCLAALGGHKVAILTRQPQRWSQRIGFVNDDLVWQPEAKYEADVHMITSEYEKCIPQSDLIFIAGVPIHHNPEILKKMKPHLPADKKVFIGSVCAYGGFNWVARRYLGKGNYSVFGTQLIPWTCGTDEYGKTGHVFGAKRTLRIATTSGKDEDGVKALLEPFMKQKLTDTDFLVSCLYPNNPSLHPPILYGLFHDWDGVSPYDPKTLPKKIYADLRTASAEHIVALDREISNIFAALRLAHPGNAHLAGNYDFRSCVIFNYQDQITCKWDTVSCILTNKAFAKHYLPYEEVEGGIVPKVKHKFFETDLPFGLVTFRDIAGMCGVATPVMDAIILWNQKLIGKQYLKEGKLRLELTGEHIDECVVPSRWGLTLETLCLDGPDAAAPPVPPAGK